MLHEALQIIHTTNKMQTKKVTQQPLRQQSAAPKVSLQKMYQSAPQFKSLGFGSTVAIHKLRETKWFKHNECKILLSVVESGFILERRCSTQLENRDWGIALWTPGQEKSKNIDHIRIYCVITEKDKKKVAMLHLNEFWLSEKEIKINNLNDKEKTPNNEEDIRKQVEAALKNKNLKWHNSQHFPYWCRYDKPTLGRIQQISDRVKMNSIGVSFGMLIMKKNRRTTTT